jgi:hypothetical protein
MKEINLPAANKCPSPLLCSENKPQNRAFKSHVSAVARGLSNLNAHHRTTFPIQTKMIYI